MSDTSVREREQMRLSVNLSPDVADALRELAHRRGKTITEVIRDAIATEKFLDDEQRKGGDIIIEHDDNVKKQLVWAK